jgi:alkylated DNA repair dioxygenase AlkB
MIKGLSYKSDHLSLLEIEEVIKFLDSVEWNMELKRATKHYGYKYDYKTRSVLKIEESIPDILISLHKTDTKFDQVIINKYKPGEQITAHTDASVFGDKICCISIGESGIIEFSKSSILSTNLTVISGSMYTMESEARTKWKHEYKNKSNGIRYSITYRTIKKST